MTFLEYGSDLVGSIRIPANFCGVYGLKPSVGIVPLTGFQPPGVPASPSDMMYMSSVGPLGRSARDLLTALRVTAGPEVPAAKAYSWTLSPGRHDRVSDFRVGVVFDHGSAPVSSEVGALLSNVVDALGRAGTTVVEGWPEGVDPVQQYESFGFHVQLFFAFQQPGQDFATLSDVIRQENYRMSVRAAWNRYFSEVDVFLCPANFTPAFPHYSRPVDQRTIATPEGEQPYANQAFWVSHASLPGLPAVVAPIGRTPGGLPVGVQILGPLHEDATAIIFAELLDELIGGYERPPMR
jgi:amidase